MVYWWKKICDFALQFKFHFVICCHNVWYNNADCFSVKMWFLTNIQETSRNEWKNSFRLYGNAEADRLPLFLGWIKLCVHHSRSPVRLGGGALECALAQSAGRVLFFNCTGPVINSSMVYIKPYITFLQRIMAADWARRSTRGLLKN